jgi:hypothetical protein
VASFTVRVGVILVILGMVSYVMTGAASMTALIPSAVGVALASCGVLARRSRAPRPAALRVALAIAGLGVIATITALGRLASVLSSADGSPRPALVARASMALILLVYVGFAVRALVRDAVKARRA